MVDYLSRIGKLSALVTKLEAKENRRLPFGAPTLKQLVPEFIAIARKNLSRVGALKVEKALHYDEAAPFTISELHSFVHQTDLPTSRDILQFWKRTEPLFRLMLEQDVP